MANWVCSACGGENPGGMQFCGHCGTPIEGTAAPAAGPAQTDDHDVAEVLRSFVSGPVAEKLVEAGGNLLHERRLITALFADVSGFTALADRLDPEQLIEVIDPVISGLSSVVGRFGGYVEKFAGDALMALFGAPVSYGDDAARALRVALEMHRELARLVVDLPHDAGLTLHVGVNSGHGIARVFGSEARLDYAVLGDSVILAQRLESAAPQGETYVSETTVRLTEDDFEFEPVGELTLKGKREPVAAWRLVGERKERTPATHTALIGRDSELGVFEDLLEQTQGGGGAVLTIMGEPGIGKSRLVETALDHAAAMGAVTLQARCLSYGAELAYWPYLDLVRRAAGLRAEERPAATRRRLAATLADAGADGAEPLLARLLGLHADDETVADLEPEAFRRGLHEAFRTWFSALAATAPVVLVLDDVHWVDASSVVLTAAQARLSRDIPLLLVLAGRPEGRAQIEAMVGGEAARSLALEPLDPSGVADLVDRMLGGKAPAELVSFVEKRTTGNPFFVQETVRALQDKGALLRREGRWTIKPGWDERDLPATIEGVLTARIDLLPRDAASLLQTASVIGRRVRVPLLQAVAGRAEIDPQLDELVAGGFVDRAHDAGDAAIVFHHALVQDAAYERLLRRRRRELHLRTAEVAEELYGAGDHVIDLLARHLYLGEAGDRAIAYLVRAAERSCRLFANAEAILHYSRAAELTPDDFDIALALADLHELVGNYDEALRLYELVIGKRDDVLAWRGAAATLRKRGEYVRALSVVNDAFATEGLAGPDLRLLWLEGVWTLSLCGRYDQAIDLAHVGLEVGDGARDSLAGQLLVQLTRAETIEGLLDQAVDHGREAEAIFNEQGDLRGLATALRLLGDAYGALGRHDDAVAVLERGLAIAERVGNVEEIGGCLINLGLIELRRGAYDAAIAYDRRAIEEFERIAHASGRTVAYANLAEMLTATGKYEEALQYSNQSLELARSIGNMLVAADATRIGATIRLRQGELEAAAAQAEEAGDLFLATGAVPYAAEAFALAAEALAASGHGERAGELEARARSLA
jgi:adenylate cyclase